MSAELPVGIELNGFSYQIVENPDLFEGLPYTWRPYEETVEAKVIQQTDLAGSSRPSKSSRPDELTWTQDDWSGGEGFKFLKSDARDDFGELVGFRRYYYGDAVDVRTRGQLSLGYLLTDDTAGLSNITSPGPYLAVTNGFLVAAASDTVGSVNRSRKKNLGTGVWAAATTGTATTGQVAGPIKGLGDFVYIAARSTGGRMRRYDPSADTSVLFVDQVSETPLPAQGKLYYLFDNGTANAEIIELRSATLVYAGAALASTTEYAVNGVGQEASMDNLGKNIYIASQGADEEPRIHVFEIGGSGAERVRMPLGFRMGVSPFESVTFLGDILFVGGWLDGGVSGSDVPMLCYVSGSHSGTVGLIRSDLISSSERIITIAGGFRNQLLMGTSTGSVFVYDVQNGGISRLFSGIPTTEDVTSIVYTRGTYYVGARVSGTGAQAGKVYKSVTSGTNRYPSTATVYSSAWDFDYPTAQKLLTKLEVLTDTMPANTTVTFSLLLDDNTTITTDKDGNALTHSSGRTSTFQLSGIKTSDNSSVSRSARIVRIDTTLTSNGTNSATPVVKKITLNALSTEFVRYYEATVSLAGDGPGQYALGTPQTGEQKANNLRTLRDTVPSPPALLKPRYATGDGDSIPETDADTVAVVMEDCAIILTRKGEGYARVRLRKLE